MAEERISWTYEKLDENYKKKYIPTNDYDGKITGHIVFGVKQWMDENPEERIRLGWIKHIHYSSEEIKKRWPYNKHNQYLLKSEKMIDEYTVEDEYHVIDKSEEMMLLEELLQTVEGRFTDSDWGPGVVIL